MDKSAHDALGILREWDWHRCDPDGVPFHAGKDLNWVVNRLAMEGIRRPQNAILTLLCQGELIARGDSHWRKYQDLAYFQTEVQYDPINARHWQQLANLFRAGDRVFGQDIAIELPQLKIKDCLVHEWDHNSCRFSYAVITDELAPWDDDYLEEWFSAWDIAVWPNNIEPIVWDDEPGPDPAAATASINKGGRPPAADWELAALEIGGRHYRGDFKPQTIADVGRELAAWLGGQDLYPSDSVVRIHAKRIFEAFQTWDRD